MHYHPADPSPSEVAAGHLSGDDFEFLELTNVGPEPLGLSHVRLLQVSDDGRPQGVAFDFGLSPIQTLDPGAQLVVVEDQSAFRFRYGDELPVAGQWSGGLSNNSELLTLVDGSITVQQFAYRDDWLPETDGSGPSLEIP